MDYLKLKYKLFFKNLNFYRFLYSSLLGLGWGGAGSGGWARVEIKIDFTKFYNKFSLIMLFGTSHLGFW